MATSMTQLLRQAAAARNAGKRQPPGPDGTSTSVPATVTPIVVRSEEPAAHGMPAAATDDHKKRSDQTVEPNGQTIRSDHTVRPEIRSNQTVRPPSLPIRSDQTVNLVRPYGQTIRSDHTVEPDGQTVFLGKQKPLARTAQQRAVYGYLAANPDIITSVNNLSEILAIAPTTLRKILTVFVQGGAICKTRIGNDGLKIQFIGEKRSDQTVRPNGQTNGQTILTSRKKDREEDLSISHEALETSWPTLARAGFGLNQIEQIHAALAQLGKSPDRIVQGLDHAEWELAEGKMLDKQGQPVADPCAWVYRSLASQGYYRRPAGYVSAEEQAERDAIEEAKALTRTRENARQERFRAWLQSLSGEEKENVLAGRIGPEEAWLKKEWAKRGEPH